MFNTLGHGLRWLGEKTSNAASWRGHKAGGTLTSISPVISLFNPVIGACVAPAGLVLMGVGALGDDSKRLMARGEFNPNEIRRTITGIRSDARVVRSAYTAVRGRRVISQRKVVNLFSRRLSNNHHEPQRLPRLPAQDKRRFLF